MTFWHSAAQAGTEIRSREQGGMTLAHLGRRKVQNTHAEGEGLDVHSPEASGKLGVGDGEVRELSDLGASLGMDGGRLTFLST